jgi:hypothetical protein
MVIIKTYIDHNSRQILLKYKEEFLIITKLENQLVREHMPLFMFAITKLQCESLQLKYTKK